MSHADSRADALGRALAVRRALHACIRREVADRPREIGVAVRARSAGAFDARPARSACWFRAIARRARCSITQPRGIARPARSKVADRLARRTVGVDDAFRSDFRHDVRDDIRRHFRTVAIGHAAVRSGASEGRGALKHTRLSGQTVRIAFAVPGSEVARAAASGERKQERHRHSGPRAHQNRPARAKEAGPSRTVSSVGAAK